MSHANICRDETRIEEDTELDSNWQIQRNDSVEEQIVGHEGFSGDFSGRWRILEQIIVHRAQIFRPPIVHDCENTSETEHKDDVDDESKVETVFSS